MKRLSAESKTMSIKRTSELLNLNTEHQPILHSIVNRHMIHGPWGILKRSASCMLTDSCSKQFLNLFSDSTTTTNDGYPSYWRRDNFHIVLVAGIKLVTRWIVPYNPYLLLKFNAHINVEILYYSFRGQIPW